MANERLRNAMEMKRVCIEKMTEVTGVDPKTIQRWINGRVPHARHRRAIADFLGEKESFLWPTNGYQEAQTSEIVVAYAHRSDVPPGAWWQLFVQATEQIDLLGIALLFLPEQHPHLVDLLKEKARISCKIRIALAHPKSMALAMRDEEEQSGLAGRIQTTLYHFRELLNYDGIEIRYHSTVLYNSYARLDHDMFIMPQLYKLHGSKAPLLHLHYSSSDGIFSNFAAHFEAVWATTVLLEDQPYGLMRSV
jgi:hypothetical protein